MRRLPSCFKHSRHCKQKILDDLRTFLARWRHYHDPVLAHRAHWGDKGAARMPPYQSQLHGAL